MQRSYNPGQWEENIGKNHKGLALKVADSSPTEPGICPTEMLVRYLTLVLEDWFRGLLCLHW